MCPLCLTGGLAEIIAATSYILTNHAYLSTKNADLLAGYDLGFSASIVLLGP